MHKPVMAKVVAVTDELGDYSADKGPDQRSGDIAGGERSEGLSALSAGRLDGDQGVGGADEPV
jgi:hypothetical protein